MHKPSNLQGYTVIPQELYDSYQKSKNFDSNSFENGEKKQKIEAKSNPDMPNRLQSTESSVLSRPKSQEFEKRPDPSIAKYFLILKQF